MTREIEKIIERIDLKIIELQQLRRILIELSGEKNSYKIKITRKYLIMELLKREGPISRRGILEKTKIPLGTVSTILNDKTLFENKKGRWGLIEVKSKEG